MKDQTRDKLIAATLVTYPLIASFPPSAPFILYKDFQILYNSRGEILALVSPDGKTRLDAKSDPSRWQGIKDAWGKMDQTIRERLMSKFRGAPAGIWHSVKSFFGAYEGGASPDIKKWIVAALIIVLVLIVIGFLHSYKAQGRISSSRSLQTFH